MAKNGNSRDGSVCCSFCKKTQNLVRKLIAGPDNVFICDECTALCSEIVAEETYYEENSFEGREIKDVKPSGSKYSKSVYLDISEDRYGRKMTEKEKSEGVWFDYMD